ncbi:MULTISPECIES: hypothetical protein [unclassified Pseudoclavibacter]|uniref:hypothetical protein n=1 Tax=unclassified Pseudoclavibacter TaxID=2615177 RepID=UPI001300FC44|nr:MULTISPECIES: hypothetical protein [unclassified Pseudoclavibacter]KAB1644467.1 hypothetical protein F8O06_10555 [Pseudoclavibacter sp. CFCC 14310]KAB1664029.1 hypothetical protein F8O08_00965 [Pseudoclavibacter sp. CFCC 13611]
MARRPANPDRTYEVVLEEFRVARAHADELKEQSKSANAAAAKLKAEATRLKRRAVSEAEKKLEKAKEEYERVIDLVEHPED